MFDMYDTKVVSANNQKKLFFFETGVYYKKQDMLEKTKNLDNYIYIKKDKKYYVYVAITEQNIDKLKNYFSEKNIDISIEEKSIDNEAFLNKIAEYDEIKNNIDNKIDIKNINKEVLKYYEEVSNDQN